MSNHIARLISLLALLLTAAPARAQSRVYTNADLGRPLSPARPAPTVDTLAALAAHQFVYVPPARVAWPSVYVTRSSPTAGPYGDFRPFDVARRLDGTSYADPPWIQIAYVGRSYGAGRVARPQTSSRPNPTSHRHR